MWVKRINSSARTLKRALAALLSYRILKSRNQRPGRDPCPSPPAHQPCGHCRGLSRPAGCYGRRPHRRRPAQARTIPSRRLQPPPAATAATAAPATRVGGAALPCPSLTTATVVDSWPADGPPLPWPAPPSLLLSSSASCCRSAVASAPRPASPVPSAALPLPRAQVRVRSRQAAAANAPPDTAARSFGGRRRL